MGEREAVLILFCLVKTSLLRAVYVVQFSLKLQGSSFFSYQSVCSKHLEFPYTQENECSLAWGFFCFVGQKDAILLSRFPGGMARYLSSIFQSAGGMRRTM